MPYRLIKGEFHLFYQGQRHVGSRPDGDSVWFRPDDPDLTEDLDGRDAEFNAGGFAQLRFEGIDALELHYQGGHQKEDETVGARDFLLGAIGFGDIAYATPSDPDDIPTSVRTAASHPRRGYILTRNVDPFGRPVAFAFAGNTNQQDGSDVYLETDRLDQSLNADLIREGHAYPAYYTGFPTDLRDHLTELADDAWGYDLGVWPVDDSIDGATVTDEEDLSTIAIWPKLYRRLYKYFRDPSSTGLSGFEEWLRDPDHDTRDDELWIISEGHLGNMHDAIHISGNRIRMQYWPEDLVIVPR